MISGHTGLPNIGKTVVSIMDYWPSFYQFQNYYTSCSRLVHTEQRTYNIKVFPIVIHKVLNRNQQVRLGLPALGQNLNLRINYGLYKTPITLSSQQVFKYRASGTCDDVKHYVFENIQPKKTVYMLG